MDYFSGQGELFASVRGLNGSIGPYLSLGNCSGFVVTIGPGGTHLAGAGALRKPGAFPTVDIDFESLNKANLASFLYGAQQAIAGGNVVENVTVKRGYMTPLSKINLSAFTHLKSTNGATTYLKGRDYTIDLLTGGLKIPANSTIPDGGTVTATYSANASVATGVFNQKSSFIMLRFNGVNTIDGTPVVAEVFKVRLDPVDALPLINDNLSSLKVVGRVFKDDGINGNRVDGHFMRILR